MTVPPEPRRGKRGRIIGCAGAGMGVALLVAAFFYATVFRPSRQVMADLDLMAGLRGMNAGIVEQGEFLPPVDGLLTEDQLTRFVRVQESMRGGLGDRMPVLAERAARLNGLAAGPGGAMEAKRLGLREAILALKGLGPVLRRAKELQVSALNAQGFSLSEYRWVRETFYHALGFTRPNVYFEDFAARRSGSPPGEERAQPPPLDANRDLAAAYGDSTRSWFPFLVFGF